MVDEFHHDRPTDQDPNAALAGLRAEAMIEDLRAERRERELTRIEATTTSLLLGLVGSPCSLFCENGDGIAGVVIEIGADYVCIDANGTLVWVRLDGIVAVSSRMDPGEVAATSDVAPTSIEHSARSMFVDVIEDLIYSESEVNLGLRGGHNVSGSPIAVGESLTVSTAGGHVLASVTAITTIRRI